MTLENSLPPSDGAFDRVDDEWTSLGQALHEAGELQRLMRWCVANPAATKKLGERARKDMVELYSPNRVIDVVMKRLIDPIQ